MTILERLARRGHKSAAAVLDAFNPDQPRDERGRWGEGGSASTSAEHSAAEAGHASAAEAAFKSGDKVLYHAHETATRAHREAAQSGSPEASLRARQATKGALEAVREARELASGERVSLAEADLARAFPGSGGPKDLRRTQTELSAVKEAPVVLMAPHSQLPVGNTKPAEPIHDLKVTQKLEAVKGIHPAIQRSHEFMKDLEAKRAGDPPVDWNKYTVPFGSPRTRFTGPNEARTNPKEARRDADAASAGRWASRALEQKAKGQSQAKKR